MDELAKRFADLAEKYGPAVGNAALDAVRVEVYSTIASAVVWFFVTAVMIKGAFFCTKKASSEHEDGWYIPAVFLGLFSILGASFVVWTFVDPWTWVALNHPELWLAKKAFKI